MWELDYKKKKKVEHRRIDAFELWCWRRLLRIPWTARRSSQSILKKISPGISLEGMMLKLKLQYFGHLRQRTAACQVSLSITTSYSLLKLMSMKSEMPSNRLILFRSLLPLPSIFPSIRVFSSESVTRSRTQLSSWTELNWLSEIAQTLYWML